MRRLLLALAVVAMLAGGCSLCCDVDLCDDDCCECCWECDCDCDCH